jgi:hypothetical protein
MKHPRDPKRRATGNIQTSLKVQVLQCFKFTVSWEGLNRQDGSLTHASAHMTGITSLPKDYEEGATTTEKVVPAEGGENMSFKTENGSVTFTPCKQNRVLFKCYRGFDEQNLNQTRKQSRYLRCCNAKQFLS